jgi:hypothetical protein
MVTCSWREVLIPECTGRKQRWTGPSQCGAVLSSNQSHVVFALGETCFPPHCGSANKGECGQGGKTKGMLLWFELSCQPMADGFVLTLKDKMVEVQHPYSNGSDFSQVDACMYPHPESPAGSLP